MDKASKVLRRSSVRLRSAGSGHTDLQLVISEIKEMRIAARWFQSSQTSAVDDLLKWALRGENRAIKDTVAQLVELNMIWSDVQRDFSDQLKEYRQQFELMLEGENQVDRCKQKLVTLEAKESKIRKDVKRSLKKGNEPEVEELQLQLKQASDATKLAQEEVTEIFKENEAVKLIRLKQNLLKMSESYVELAHKCIHIFEAQSDVAHALPDAPSTNIHDIKYTGAVAVRNAVHDAKDKVQRYRRHSLSHTVSSESNHESAQPPPYNPHYPREARRSSTGPEFGYPDIEAARGCNSSGHVVSQTSPPDYERRYYNHRA